jgi:sterol desaturase/sphingolipid hydroxylase (fatty acid hydroxylase superfamily)
VEATVSSSDAETINIVDRSKKMPHLHDILTATVVLTLIGVVLSAIGSVIAFYQRGGGSVRDFFRYIIPRDLYTRRSCYLDVGFVLLKQLTRPLVAVPMLLLTSAQGAIATYGLLILAFGPGPQNEMPIVLFGALLIPAVLVQDFLRFKTHYWLHQFHVLWDIHKVHHSADFLTPVTNHRVHLIEEMIQQAATGWSVGPILGIAAFLTATPISTNTLLGFDAYGLIDTLSFGILRHSHIGLSYGWLERYLMSPKQHHQHHSSDRQHWDKNFGFLLACWDRMAGTICYSNPKENVSVGILPEEAVDYNSVLKLHFMPYIKLFRRCLPHPQSGPSIPVGPSGDVGVAPVPET